MAALWGQDGPWLADPPWQAWRMTEAVGPEADAAVRARAPKTDRAMASHQVVQTVTSAQTLQGICSSLAVAQKAPAPVVVVAWYFARWPGPEKGA